MTGSSISILAVLIGVTVAIVLIVGGAMVVRRRRQQERHERNTERAAREHVTRKAAAAVQQGNAYAVDLSQSDAISIRDEIDRCIASGRWDEATKWALHAINSRPDRPEFRVKLAEIYCRSGNRKRFLALFQELSGTLDPNSDPYARLLALAAEIIPDHAALQR